MTTSKVFLRNFIGLILIISAILSALCILLEILGLFTYLNHETLISSSFFHESLYLMVFFIPSYFIGRIINRAPIFQIIEQTYNSEKKPADTQLQKGITQ